MSDEKLRILLVGAHTAEAFDNAGGTLCHHVENDDQVTSLVLTQGGRVHSVALDEFVRRNGRSPSADELKRLIAAEVEEKRRQVRKACGILGITDVRFLDYDDAVLVVKEEIILEVARIIRQVRPHVIITHWPGEQGGWGNQHATTGEITLHAIGAAASSYPGDPNPPHSVIQVFFMGTPVALMRNTIFGALGGFYADVVIDISDVIERKLRALDCLKGQGYNGPYARKRIEAVDGTTGFFARGGQAAYAESFMRMNSETYTLLPVSQRARDWLKLSESERFRRYCRLVAHTIPEESR